MSDIGDAAKRGVWRVDIDTESILGAPSRGARREMMLAEDPQLDACSWSRHGTASTGRRSRRIEQVRAH